MQQQRLQLLACVLVAAAVAAPEPHQPPQTTAPQTPNGLDLDVPANLRHMSAYDYDAALQSNWSTFGKSGNLSALLDGFAQHAFPGLYRIDCPTVIGGQVRRADRPSAWPARGATSSLLLCAAWLVRGTTSVLARSLACQRAASLLVRSKCAAWVHVAALSQGIACCVNDAQREGRRQHASHRAWQPDACVVPATSALHR